MLLQHSCDRVVIVSDMNQHLVTRSFGELLKVVSLVNLVDFPTHTSGSFLDPVISNLPDSGTVALLDHLSQSS